MKKSNILVVLIAALVITLTSCKKEVGPDKQYTDIQRAGDFLHLVMKEWYFWYKQMPQVKASDYPDPYYLLEALRYRPVDRWSNVTDYNEFHAYYSGSFAGHGFTIGLDNSDKARIAMIYRQSPLYAEGVRRGWIVESVNGVNIAQLLASGDIAGYNTVMGPRKPNITNNFKFITPAGDTLSITSTKAEFTVNSVLEYDILNLASGKTGYLAFESFIETSYKELEDAFTLFVENDISQLILDLRYNSGGLLDVAVNLASYIAGNDESGKIFISVIHNDKQTRENGTIPFKTTGYSLNISKLAVITTRSTASASENVINGLTPYVEVKCFGDKTSGKPVGMYAFEDPKKLFVFLPITFQLLNANGYGDYFGGIEPYQYITDDITHDFGDPEELSLKAAIEYLETGGTKSAAKHLPFRPSLVVDEKPEWQKNLFIMKTEAAK